MKKIIALLFSLFTLFFAFSVHAKLNEAVIVKNEKDVPAHDIAFAPCVPSTPAPTVDVQNPVCILGGEEDGKAFITDYNPSMVYLFTPSGPSVNSSGEITGYVSGQNYTVVADNGTCTSESASFTVFSWDDFDCDGDGVTNGQEILDETDPYDLCDYDDHHQDNPSQTWEDSDCDGDGVSNGQELLDGTHPLDICSFLLGSQQTPSQAWLDGDCDGDGVTNGDEVADGTDPLLSCDLVIASQTVTPNAGWLNSDCDGDGVTNGDEVTDGTDPFDVCDYIETSQTLSPAFAWNQADCDGDGVSNEDELIDGTDPFDACDFNLSSQGTPTQAWLDADCDGDGISNEDELIDGTDPLDPCDPNQPSIPTATAVQPDCTTPTGEVSVTNPIVGAQYTLTGLPPISFTEVNSTGLFVNLSPGSYELKVLLNGCESAPLLVEIHQGVPNPPIFNIVPSTCTTPETASIDNFNPDFTYDFSPNDGIGVDGSGNVINATIGVVYDVIATNGIGCSSSVSTLELNDMLPTPDAPDIQVTAAACGVDGFAEVLNYNSSYTYLFSPSSGVFVNNTNNKIMGASFGTSYTVKVVNSDGCESETESFVVDERLLIPSYTFTTIQPTQCGEDGVVTFTFTNVQDGTYTMTYTGGSFEINISGGTGVVVLPDGMYSNVTIHNGDCASTVGSTIQIINPVTPPTPTVITHGINCSTGADGFTLITNYDASLNYNFDPVGPTISATGEIENAVYGVTYTLTTVESGCHSTAATFTNIAWVDGDCDGDGVTNGDEIDDETDPHNLCDFVVEHQTLPPSQQWLDLDCDRDGVTNGDEIVDGTDPANPCDLISTSQTVPPSNEWLNGDCDGDGVSNGTEVIDGTDFLDACDFIQAHINNPSQAWLNSDCDGDGVSNGDELDAGTDLLDLCDYHQDQVSLPQSQEWYDRDCDGDGVVNGDESNDGTDIFDFCDLIVEHQTVPPSQDWLDADCDEDGVSNGDELAVGGDIHNPCSPNVCALFVPEIFTPDGDGINDYWRIDGIENYPNNTLVILNRWGNVVYETEGYNNEWDGRSTSNLNIGGDELPTGTYYYVLDTKNSEIGVLKGYVYLQR